MMRPNPWILIMTILLSVAWSLERGVNFLLTFYLDNFNNDFIFNGEIFCPFFLFINCKRVVCETKVISVNNGVMESRSTLISSKLWLTVERWWACTKADEAETLVSQQTCDKVALSFYTRRKHAATCCDLMMQLFSSVGVAKLWFCSHELYFGNTWLK